MPTGFTSRSAQSVRRVGPESSRKLRIAEDLKDKGFASAANQVAYEAAQIKASESPIDTPTQRRAREAAKEAIAIGQQAAIKGDFDPAAVVAPMKQQFFGAVANLPREQRSALLNRFEPQFRKQRMENMAEQQSFLQLKDAQRKAKVNQDIDAVKVQVQQRLAEIDPLAPAKEQSRQIQNIVRQNPSVLGDMATVRNINMMYEPINRELSAQQGREASQFQAKISTAASLANKGVYKPELLKSISSGKEFDAFLQGAAQASKEINTQTSTSKFQEDLLSDLSRQPQTSLIEAMESGAFRGASPSTLVRLKLLAAMKDREARGEATSTTITIINDFKDNGVKLLSHSATKQTDDPKAIKQGVHNMLRAFFNTLGGGALEVYKTLGSAFPLTQDEKGNVITLQQAVGTRPNEASIISGVLKHVDTIDEYRNFLTSLQAKLEFGQQRRSSPNAVTQGKFQR